MHFQKNILSLAGREVSLKTAKHIQRQVLAWLPAQVKTKGGSHLKSWVLPATLFSAGIILILLSLGLNYNALFKHQSDAVIGINSIAPETDLCKQNNTITYSCYKKELTDLTNQRGPEYAMALIEQQSPNNMYVQTQCHQLTHIVGRAALSKYQDLATTFVHGDPFCASGYFHGASEEIIAEKGADYMIKNAEKICQPFATKDFHKLNHYNCVHGIGHGLMEATAGNLFASLKGCDKLTDPWERDSCYSGVFMQNVMIEQSPDESVDHKSAYLKADQPMYPCTAVEDRYKAGCYIFQSSYALSKVGFDFRKVFALCTTDAGPKYRDICYGSLGRDASGSSNLSKLKTISTCDEGPNSEAIMQCLIGAAKNIIYSYHDDKQAYDFCNSVATLYQYDCRSTVKDYYRTF